MQIWLIECSAPHWVDVARALAQSSVRVSVWTGISGSFPAEMADQLIDTRDAKLGAGTPSGQFDDVCQSVWNEEAQTVYDMMNRFDHSRDLGMMERQSLFKRTLLFWRGMLERRPDLVVFPAPPHVVYDYILLALCRRLQLKTLMFEEATIAMPYRLEMADYLDGDTSLRAGAVTLTDTPSFEARAIAAKLRGEYRSAMPQREIEARKSMQFAGPIRRVVQLAKAAARDTIGRSPQPASQSLEKEAGLSLPDSFRGRFPRLSYTRQSHREQAIMARWRDKYNSLAVPLDRISGPIIYLALAGQPERTSNPQAGTFANQQLIVSMLSDTAPEGVTVVVKEHPNQFHPLFHANMCRSETYYDEIASPPNVRIVPTTTDPFALIDRSIAAATTGGTVALEAVARQKPVLLFGDAWYRDCPGMYRVRRLEDLHRFFVAPPVVDKSSLERFVETVFRSCKRGMADAPPVGWVMDEDENVRNLTMSIRNRLS